VLAAVALAPSSRKWSATVHLTPGRCIKPDLATGAACNLDGELREVSLSAGVALRACEPTSLAADVADAVAVRGHEFVGAVKP
jgi:hypothetical protein